jgi:hypothetical protein
LDPAPFFTRSNHHSSEPKRSLYLDLTRTLALAATQRAIASRRALTAIIASAIAIEKALVTAANLANALDAGRRTIGNHAHFVAVPTVCFIEIDVCLATIAIVVVATFVA